MHCNDRVGQSSLMILICVTKSWHWDVSPSAKAVNCGKDETEVLVETGPNFGGENQDIKNDLYRFTHH